MAKRSGKTLIVIPVYNGENFIIRSLNSCVRQTQVTAVYVVDNCSTDNTRNLVTEFSEKHSNVSLIVNEKNLGRVGNWNRCLEIFEASEYQYIKFLFCGDELLPNCVEAVESVFASHDKLSVVLWPYHFRKPDGTESVVRAFDKEQKMSKQYLAENGYFPSRVTGAIVCNTYAKWATVNERFNEDTLGAHSFSNKCVPKGDVYHIDEVLSVFNVDCHRSFNKQFENYLYVLETAFTRAMALEQNKDWIPEAKYDGIRREIFGELKRVINAAESQNQSAPIQQMREAEQND